MSTLKVTVSEMPFGIHLENGLQKQVVKFQMTGTWPSEDSPAVCATVSSLGAALVSLLVPDSHGTLEDVVLGFDHLKDYEQQQLYMGVTVGRNASRVGGSQFTLNGRTHRLVQNTPGSHLHGGLVGFSKRVWAAEADKNSVTFTYYSRDGEEGYPGDLMAQVTYGLIVHEGCPALSLQYRGLANISTPLNMTHHSYFNLAGHASGPKGLDEHRIMINSKKKLLLDAGIANGEMVELMPGQRQGALPEVMRSHGGGIDDVFVLAESGTIQHAATLCHQTSGRALTVFTDQPALVVYTTNDVPVTGLTGRGGATYRRHGAITLETSGYPNAVNVPAFPSVILRPGHVYNHTCIYKLGV